jgi:hypothetical protein
VAWDIPLTDHSITERYIDHYPLEKQMEYNALLLNLEDNQKTERDKLVEQLSSLSTKELAELLAKKK